MRKIFIITAAIIGLCLLAQPGFAASATKKIYTKEQFIQHMVDKYHLDKAEISNLVYGVKILKRPVKKVKHPYEKEEPWYIYRTAFVNDDHVQGGLIYWQKHTEALAKTEAKFGVPASMIVAILGVETHYGESTGKTKVLDSLVTLAFTPTKQQYFFQYELEQYFLLTKELKLDPQKVLGSFAGAVGYPQFMPGAYRQYAVDFDGNGTKDLFNDTADVTASIANFFKHLGWHKGEPITIPAVVKGDAYKTILNHRLTTPYTIAELKKLGITPATSIPNNTKANLLRLKTKNGYEFWLALHNFYVITRYNASPLYAMAAYQLSQEIAQDHATILKKNFISKMVNNYHFGQNYITQLLTNIQFTPDSIQLIEKPYEARAWYLYNKIFLNEKRVLDGIEYWQSHEADLSRAEQQYGVPASIIVAIVGVESDYGRNKGNYPVLNTLGTLAFYYPPRADFFQEELAQFLLLARKFHLDPTTLTGSYAGALGYPQFMPSSYRYYAVDFNHKHNEDLFHDTSDVIGSVANYFHHAGWRTNDLIAEPATVKGNNYRKLLNVDLKPK
ncbi:MAG: lytic murein transglycosylase B, partial [Gammaproteobacteria bacterium]|nr:lytic murein transglycosylase B [Gammaproteobacteria bacterium]